MPDDITTIEASLEHSDNDVPFLLLPVRLETRFAETVTGARELLIRVIPTTSSSTRTSPSSPRRSPPPGAGTGPRRGRNSRRRGTRTRRASSSPSTCPSARRGSRSPRARRTSGPVMPHHSSPTSRRASSRGRAPRTPRCCRIGGWPGVACSATPSVRSSGTRSRSRSSSARTPTRTRCPPICSTCLDADAAWIVDFDIAEAQGMALRLPLTGSSSRGLNAVFVAGVKTIARRRRSLTDRRPPQRAPPHRRPRARPAGNTDEQHHRRSRGFRPRRRPSRTPAHRARRPVVHAGGRQRH